LATFEVSQLVIQGAGVVGVILTLAVYYRQLRTMERQHRALEREIGARLRPWMGMFGLAYEEPKLPLSDADEILRIVFRNFGALPAQRVNLNLNMTPAAAQETVEDAPITWQEVGVKALVPGEEGNYRIILKDYPRFAAWKEARRDVLLSGKMSYSLAERSFATEFEGVLRFSEPADLGGRVRNRWRNREVT
jgi:hypothetical protein